MPRKAKATETLLGQINALVPVRNESSDGWIGDAAHQATKSEHNPNSKGVVRALDITHDPRAGCDSYKLAQAILDAQDKRLMYVISNRKIGSGPRGPSPGKWRPYSGKNPHDLHCHFSVGRLNTYDGSDADLYDDAAPWDLAGFHGIPDYAAPVHSLPNVRRGDKGFYVSLVQTTLGGHTVDGDFGPMTDQAVRQFQRDHHLDDDGIVGPYTWRELLRPWAKGVSLLPADPKAKLVEMAVLAQKTGSTATIDELVAGYLTILSDILPPGFSITPEPEPPPPLSLAVKIANIAQQSEIAAYRWGNRGVAPMGYTKGIALAFANTLTRYHAGNTAAILMASADTYNDTKDALSWYRSNFKAKGMTNEVAGLDTLRHLYVLMMGLGMRESSGRHCCGIDTSAGASSRKADTCEAGLFQQSWNSHAASDEIEKLFDEYSESPADCLKSIFAEGVSCTAAEWKNWGTGQGAEFQDLAKNCPMFACESAGVCLRVLRKHFGPINRKEAEIVKAADDMLHEVQMLIEQSVSDTALAA